jgi:hypothetical protein
MTHAHSETGQMAVCCQNLTLGVLSSHSALSVLVGTLFKKFGLFLNMPCKFSEINNTHNNGQYLNTMVDTEALLYE